MGPPSTTSRRAASPGSARCATSPAGAITPSRWGPMASSTPGAATMPASLATGSPVRVSFLTGVVGIAAGSNFGLAVLRSQYGGAVFAWGDNSHGQLGDGTNTGRSRPDRVKSTGDGKIPFVLSNPGTIMTQVAA